MTKQRNIEKEELAKQIANKSNDVKTVYESLEEDIFRAFRWFSSLIDKLFYSKKYASLFALVLACLAYFTVTYDKNSSTTLSSSKTLSNVSISTRYNSESFELSGLPASCDVVLSGESANVTNAASKKGSCYINLEGYTEGTHIVKMTTTGYGDSVNTIVSPSEVTITLKKKTTSQFDLSYDFLNQNLLDAKYILSEPVFSSGSKINIRASQDTLNSISLVKALIDVTGQSSDFEIEAPLVAYDKSGKVVNAEIVPDTVVASVKITSPHKDVDIKLNPTGAAPETIAVDKITMDHQTTTIYAPEAVLATINEVYVNFDLSTITGNTEVMMPVTLPSKVSASDITTVNVKVETTEVVTREIAISGSALQYRNNNNNLAVKNYDLDEVIIKVTGSKENVESIDEDSIIVYFDCQDLEVGTYDLPLLIEYPANPYVSLTLDTKSINITFVEAS